MKPGQMIKKCTSQSGRVITLRLPDVSDVTALMNYINTISLENTFISFGGEQVTLEQETKWLEGVVARLKDGNAIHILAFDGDTLIGTTSVERDLAGKSRTYHVGNFGITIKKEYRGDGIGREMMQAVIDNAQKYMNISLVVLSRFEINERARILYESLGFKKYGTIPGGYYYKGTYTNCTYMYKDLRSDTTLVED